VIESMTMSPSPIEPLQDIVIVGGGTAGWMTAAALAKVLQGRYRIRLVESDDIGTIGVGEATIPMIQLYNKVLEIDEHEFMRETQGTIKLGIEFVNWGRVGDRYMHGFGRFGPGPVDRSVRPVLAPHAYSGACTRPGRATRSIAWPAQAHRFLRAQPEMANSPLADIVHAFHFDASLYARYLRRYAESRGVQRVEGRIVDVLLRGSNGPCRIRTARRRNVRAGRAVH
jgi:tryptophan halogenase